MWRDGLGKSKVIKTDDVDQVEVGGGGKPNYSLFAKEVPPWKKPNQLRQQEVKYAGTAH
jgi:hypothetical protein